VTPVGEFREREVPGSEETCHRCGEPLPPAAADHPEAAGGAPAMLVTCPACAEVQVRSRGVPLCDGERLALRNALTYLARRRGRASAGPPGAEGA
jgi:hypothetical protein